MLPAANVTARQRGSGSGGAIRLAAVVLLVALLALCLAHADAAASRSLASRAPASEVKGVASASLENVRAQEEVERGHYTTLAAAAEEEDERPAVPERVELEVKVIEDYTPIGPNNKHLPHP